MRINKTISFSILALFLVSVAGWYLLSESSKPVETKSPSKLEQKVQELKKKRKVKADKIREARLVHPHPASERVKPDIMAFTDDEEEKLNAFSKQVLRELQEALDFGDFKVVSKFAKKIMETPPDPKFGKDGVSVVLRQKAVEALGWFGAAALPELAGMLADSDPEIVSATFDQFLLALEDISLSDYERAEIVCMASKVLTNVDDLEMLFAEINNMRHSVGASALVEISLEGTDAAKSLMPDAIEFFTGEENIETVEDVEKWLAENPDDADDDDLYGGSTDNDE